MGSTCRCFTVWGRGLWFHFCASQLSMLWEQSFQLLRFGTYAQLSRSNEACLPLENFLFLSLYFFPFKVNPLKLVYKVMGFLMAFSYVCAMILGSNLSSFLFTFNMIIFSFLVISLVLLSRFSKICIFRCFQQENCSKQPTPWFPGWSMLGVPRYSLQLI